VSGLASIAKISHKMGSATFSPSIRNGQNPHVGSSLVSPPTSSVLPHRRGRNAGSWGLVFECMDVLRVGGIPRTSSSDPASSGVGSEKYFKVAAQIMFLT